MQCHKSAHFHSGQQWHRMTSVSRIHRVQQCKSRKRLNGKELLLFISLQPLLEGLRRRHKNLHLGRNKMDMKDGLNRSEECSCRGANGNVCTRSCEREGGCIIRAQQMWPAAIRLRERAMSSAVPASATSAPSGEIHLHNLCQQVPNAPKNEGGREERREKTLTK